MCRIYSNPEDQHHVRISPAVYQLYKGNGTVRTLYAGFRSYDVAIHVQSKGLEQFANAITLFDCDYSNIIERTCE